MRTRVIGTLAIVAICLLETACNTVAGAKEDAASVGRVFTDHPDGSKK